MKDDKGKVNKLDTCYTECVSYIFLILIGMPTLLLLQTKISHALLLQYANSIIQLIEYAFSTNYSENCSWFMFKLFQLCEKMLFMTFCKSILNREIQISYVIIRSEA